MNYFISTVNQIDEYLKTDATMYYGSFVEALCGEPIHPRDIDVLVFVKDASEERTESLTVPFVDLPVNVEYITLDKYREELHRIEPKYLCVYSNNNNILLRHGTRLGIKSTEIVRKNISRAADRALDKGRKKLLISSDYDPVLGLKNIYHSVKFPIYAIRAYKIDENYDFHKDLDTIFLMNFKSNLERIYYNSTGTLAERCHELMSFAKPIHNSVMTEFRKHFPKG